ncbi:MAG: aminoglycoside 3'-phosphotransferase [Eubacterium sp.]|nr:aminoglycoside 3'-phosphotransferase [Eubacterium sp.]
MIELKNLPIEIYRLIKDLSYQTDSIGESDSTVLLFENMVLKIEKSSPQADNERGVMNWLRGKLPVPKVIAFAQENGYNYLLMSKLEGEMSCSEHNLKSLENTVIALAEGLKMLWSVDISDCPYVNDLDIKLKSAKYNIENGLVDTDDFNEDTLGEGGFEDVDELYDFLLNNRPEEDLVLSHGDYCLPNIFIKDGKVSGFLDLGKTGIADRWQDIALCVRSLKYNICDWFGLSENDYDKYKALFYSRLGIEEDAQKLRYYILLDELF